jgi:imidazolonepropionase-like amidohydrolase
VFKEDSSWYSQLLTPRIDSRLEISLSRKSIVNMSYTRMMAETEDWEFVPNPVARTSSCTEAGSASSPTTTCIIADLLIPGKGRPKQDQAVIMQKGKIVYVGTLQGVPPEHKDCRPISVPVLMPGLWEAHAHMMGASPNKPINMQNMLMGNAASAGARCARALRDTLYAGYTSCIDLGGYAPELQTVLDEGVLLGPTLYGTGAALSQTAGHGDVFEIPLGSVWQKLSVNSQSTDVGTIPIIIADGVEEVQKAVRINLRRGAKVIKVFTSGGATSLSDNPMYQQFSDAELKVIVDEAARFGLVCAAHAIGKAGILAAVRAGFKTIEHGTYIDDEVITEMKKNDVMLVATITPIQSILDNKDSYPPEMYRKTLALANTHKAAYSNAIKAGIKCAIGSDLFGGSGSVLGAGQNGKEIGYAVKAGMTPLEAIEAATVNGPLTLGPQAPKSGHIAAGFDADLLALDENPLEDIGILATPSKIKRIWKGGKLVKAPGLDYWDVVGGV